MSRKLVLEMTEEAKVEAIDGWRRRRRRIGNWELGFVSFV